MKHKPTASNAESNVMPLFMEPVPITAKRKESLTSAEASKQDGIKLKATAQHIAQSVLEDLGISSTSPYVTFHDVQRAAEQAAARALTE